MKNEQNILRVALYIRVSTEEQVMHGFSLQAQEEQLVQYANDKGHKIVDVYRDEGFSARKPALTRPAMQALLADVEAGKIDRILFIKLDRWFRNVREYHKVQAVLDKCHVTWEATMEDYSTATADGRLKVNIMLSVAENEADRTSERIKFVNNSKIQRKEDYFSSANRPFGYTVQVIDGVKRCVKDPATEPMISDFWREVLKTGSVRKAGNFCNAKYAHTRSYKGWMKLSRNEIYTGTVRGVVDFCPAYIDHREWETIIDGRNTIKQPSNPNLVYLFTGLVRCPSCGYVMSGCNSGHRSKNIFKRYRCNRSGTTCDYRHIISERKIEDYLLANVREQLEQYIVLKSQQQTGKKKKSAAAVDVSKLNERLRRLNVIYMDGSLTDAEYTAQSKKLKAEISAANEREKSEAPADTSALQAFLQSNFEGAYQLMTDVEKRQMWRSIIERIHVDSSGVCSIDFKA